jgi:adenylate cyclase
MSRFYRALSLGVITGFIGLVLTSIFVAFHLDEHWDLALLFSLRGERSPPQEVVIVSIDEESSYRLAVPEDPKRWSRAYHARLTDILAHKGASVIAFDLFFNNPRSGEEDVLFGKALGRAGNVVLNEYLKKIKTRNERGVVSEQLHTEKYILPVAPLAQAAASIASFPLPYETSRISQYWTFKQGASNIPTLPVVVFQIFSLDMYDEFVQLLKKHSPSPINGLPANRKEMIHYGNINNVIHAIRTIFEQNPYIAAPMLKDIQLYAPQKKSLLASMVKIYESPGSRYLNFYGPPRTVTTVPYYQVLQPDQAHPAHTLDFKGKAVFIGLSEAMWSENYSDSHHTVFSQSGGVGISGVEIAATAFSNILEDMPVRPLGSGKQLAVVFLWGFIIGVLFERLLPAVFSLKETIIPAVIALAVCSFYVLAVLHKFTSAGIWYPFVVPLIQVPAAFVVSLVFRSAYRERTGCGVYLFTDVINFTRFSEHITPESLRKIMGQYYGAIAMAVERYDGVMETVPGDALLARWEAKKSDASKTKQKKKACLAALEIKKETDRFLTFSKEHLHTRIGIHFGHASRGQIGSRHQRQITTFGDTVNTAQRIEALNKHLGTEILLSREVLTHTNGILVREVGEFIPAGKSIPVALYELICSAKDSTEQQNEFCSLFSDALSAFRKRSWDDAEKKFTDLINMFGADGPSQYYRRLCEQYRQTPPDKWWKGEIRLNEK